MRFICVCVKSSVAVSATAMNIIFFTKEDGMFIAIVDLDCIHLLLVVESEFDRFNCMRITYEYLNEFEHSIIELVIF
jgi:hypothetical protein